MNPNRIWRFTLGGWTIACLAVSRQDAQAYIGRLYGGRAAYGGEWHGEAGMACGHTTPRRQDEIHAAFEKWMND